MRTIADLHIHSRHSRATGKDLNIANLEKYALLKGIDLLGTGDFTHPQWIKELKENLGDSEGKGIFRSKKGFPFILTTELSLVYTQGKGKRVHNLIFAPNFDVVDQITEYLLTKGRVDYDGRPIFKLSCIEFTEAMMSISKDIEIIPAHAWTPWFGVLGEKGGFDTLKEAFGDQVNHVHAIETGLSSDPAMNWRIKELDRYQLVSFSDLHSYWPWRMGREATIFNINLSYKNLLNALRTGEGLAETFEVDPGYGKYHFTGHRKCNVCLHPKDAVRVGNKCPQCGKKLTVGVMERVEQLADPSRPEGFTLKNAKPFRTLLPLSDILSKILGKAVGTKAVWEEYNTLISRFKSEYAVLLNAPPDELKKIANQKIVDAILKNRNAEVEIQPGFDGEYGIPIFSESDRVKYLDRIDENKIVKHIPKGKQSTLSTF